MGRFALCPFFMNEKRLSISCEDTVRQFYSKAEKKKQLKLYCDSDWQKCQYAIALNNLYERMDEMSSQKDRDVAALEHQVMVRKKENEELRQTVGRLNAKISSMNMMIGFLCDKVGISEIALDDMAAFYAAYEVNWKKSGDKTIIIDKVKKNGR